jgi:lipid-A-disaccharide synthase-like uncharacterized protein
MSRAIACKITGRVFACQITIRYVLLFSADAKSSRDTLPGAFSLFTSMSAGLSVFYNINPDDSLYGKQLLNNSIRTYT